MAKVFPLTERPAPGGDDFEDLVDVVNTTAPGAAAQLLQGSPEPGVVRQQVRNP